MKERPILFNDAMVRAILDGKKTQTRQPVIASRALMHGHSYVSDLEETLRLGCCRAHPSFDLASAGPYGVPGDRLWVREAWAPYDSADTPLDDEEIAECARYRADGVTYIYGSEGVMRPLDMYGVPPHREIPGGPHRWRPSIHMPRWACRLVLEVTDVRVERLCDIGWDANPWVWVVSFRRLDDVAQRGAS